MNEETFEQVLKQFEKDELPLPERSNRRRSSNLYFEATRSPHLQLQPVGPLRLWHGNWGVR